MTIFGSRLKAGKLRQPTEVPAQGPQGQPSPGNAVAAPSWRYGSQPIPFSFAHRLGVASSLMSPMTRGRFRPLEGGDPTHRGGSPDLGALQQFRGLVGLPRTLKLGAQAGPSSQPGFPSTGSGGVLPQLAAMPRPGVQRIRGL